MLESKEESEDGGWASVWEVPELDISPFVGLRVLFCGQHLSEYMMDDLQTLAPTDEKVIESRVKQVSVDIRDRSKRLPKPDVNATPSSGPHPAGSSIHRVDSARAYKETLDAEYHSDRTGKRTLNQYELGPVLGHGSFGIVELAQDINTRERFVCQHSKREA